MASHRRKESGGATCILNGHSAHVEEAKAHIVRISGEFGVETEVVVTKRGDDISSLAARALSERREPIVAGGGDGTVNAVAGKLAGGEVALGVLPMGTLNHFAKDVGVPVNLEAAVRNLFTGQIAKVDVGEVNGRNLREQLGRRLLSAFRAAERTAGAARIQQAGGVHARPKIAVTGVFSAADETSHGRRRRVGGRHAILVRGQ